MCESFGHCARNAFIDDAVRLLVQQMSLGTAKIRGIVLLLVRYKVAGKLFKSLYWYWYWYLLRRDVCFLYAVYKGWLCKILSLWSKSQAMPWWRKTIICRWMYTNSNQRIKSYNCSVFYFSLFIQLPSFTFAPQTQGIVQPGNRCICWSCFHRDWRTMWVLWIVGTPCSKQQTIRGTCMDHVCPLNPT